MNSEIKSVCRVENCNRKIHAKSYCSKHYAHIRHYGEILASTKFEKNTFEIVGDVVYLQLYVHADEPLTVAFVDLEDLGKVKNIRWTLSNWGYARNLQAGLMHRLIAGVADKREVHHKNLNRLDNRKLNLEIIHSRSAHQLLHIKGKKMASV